MAVYIDRLFTLKKIFMDEIWKDIEGYEGLYQVSNLGRIKAFAKKGLPQDKILRVQIQMDTE